jgi:hypothetical protein
MTGRGEMRNLPDEYLCMEESRPSVQKLVHVAVRRLRSQQRHERLDVVAGHGCEQRSDREDARLAAEHADITCLPVRALHRIQAKSAVLA